MPFIWVTLVPWSTVPRGKSEGRPSAIVRVHLLKSHELTGGGTGSMGARLTAGTMEKGKKKSRRRVSDYCATSPRDDPHGADPVVPSDLVGVAPRPTCTAGKWHP